MLIFTIGAENRSKLMSLLDSSDTDITGFPEVRIFLFIAEYETLWSTFMNAQGETHDLKGHMRVRTANVATLSLG